MHWADIFKAIVCLCGWTVNFFCKPRSQSSVNLTYSISKLLRLANVPSCITLKAFEDKNLRRSYSKKYFELNNMWLLIIANTRIMDFANEKEQIAYYGYVIVIICHNFVPQLNTKIMVQFSYSRQYLGIETISCRLLQGIGRMGID